MSNSSKKIALFDLDGTLVGAHLWLGLTKHHLKARENLIPVFWYIASHLAMAPFWKMNLISTEKYYQSWGKNLAIMIKGAKIDKAGKIFDWVSDRHLLPTLKKSVFEKLKEHQKDGFLTVLISGSFQDLVEVIARRLNIDYAIGTELEINSDGDGFSGKIIPPFCFGQEKAEKLKNFLSEKKLKINSEESFAYSDSFFDLPMLEMVGNPVAVEPDKKLLKIASNRGWQII